MALYIYARAQRGEPFRDSRRLRSFELIVEIMFFHLSAQDVVFRQVENVVRKVRHVLGVFVASIGYRESACLAWRAMPATW